MADSLSWPDSWGPIHKVTTDGKTVGREDGDVTQHHVTGGDAVRHPVSYNATDARHGHENNIGGNWPSIDHMSGPVTEHDWDHSTGHFPDGPGPWRQT